MAIPYVEFKTSWVVSRPGTFWAKCPLRIRILRRSDGDSWHGWRGWRPASRMICYNHGTIGWRTSPQAVDWKELLGLQEQQQQQQEEDVDPLTLLRHQIPFHTDTITRAHVVSWRPDRCDGLPFAHYRRHGRLRRNCLRGMWCTCGGIAMIGMPMPCMWGTTTKNRVA